MHLLLHKDQYCNVFGTVVFRLDARVSLTDEERASIRRYGFERALLYSRAELTDPGSGLLGFASRLAFTAMNVSVTVQDLLDGKRVESKDIVELLAAEEQIKESAATLKQILAAALHFAGEETIAI